MQNMSTQTMIHMGVELVVAGGIIFWTQKKVSGLTAENLILKGEIEELKEAMGRQAEMLQQHNLILRQIVGPSPPQQQSSSRNEGQRLRSQPPQQSSSPRTVRRSPPRSPQQYSQVTEPKTRQLPKEAEISPDDNEDGESEVPSEDLDELIKAELSDLKSSRTECKGDSCAIPVRRRKKKN